MAARSKTPRPVSALTMNGCRSMAHLIQGDTAKKNALPFRGVGSVAGPMALTYALTLVLEACEVWDFWIITPGTVPVLLLVARTLTDIIPILAILLSRLAIFFLSLYRIHRQMVAVKKHYMEWVRSLYAQAFQPVRKERSLDALRTQAPVPSAVEALERRAEAIYPWPFDASIPGRIAAIITSVIAAIVARRVLSSLGL
jgi:hypothetical protein